jgi:hypothetical protein
MGNERVICCPCLQRCAISTHAWTVSSFICALVCHHFACGRYGMVVNAGADVPVLSPVAVYSELLMGMEFAKTATKH